MIDRKGLMYPEEPVSPPKPDPFKVAFDEANLSNLERLMLMQLATSLQITAYHRGDACDFEDGLHDALQFYRKYCTDCQEKKHPTCL